MGIRWLKMDKMSDKMRRHSGKMPKMKDVLSVFTALGRYGSEEPANNRMKRGPRWPQESPSWPQDGPRRDQDEAKMAQHWTRRSKLKPRRLYAKKY